MALPSWLDEPPPEASRVVDPAPRADPFAERWGPALDDSTPAVDVPADRWDWEVANWPADRWSAWHRRVGELLAARPAEGDVPGPDAEEIRGAKHRAYLEARAEAEAADRRARPFAGKALGPFGKLRATS